MKILDEVRNIMRTKHYSRHTEARYCEWIKRYIIFYKMQSRNELFIQPEQRIEEFLTHLAVNNNVAVSTQNQALNALIFLYKQVLEFELEHRIKSKGWCGS